MPRPAARRVAAGAAPRAGRVQYRLTEPGEVLPAGGKVVSMLDLSDVYMTLFLPEITAGRLAIGAPVRLVLDLAPQYVIPAKVSFVAAEAQFGAARRIDIRLAAGDAVDAEAQGA